MIGVLDYGVGNVGSILNSLKAVRAPATAVKAPDDLDACDRFILPGVGAFDHAVGLLTSSGMLDVLLDRVQGGAYLLGICVGMQILADGSQEGELAGLGLVPGRVRLIPMEPDVRPGLPHLGWNSVEVRQPVPLLDGLQGAEFYFMHSYRFECANAASALGTATYGCAIDAVVGRDRVFGVQFHPEKSHGNGDRLLSNFANLA